MSARRVDARTSGGATAVDRTGHARPWCRARLHHAAAPRTHPSQARYRPLRAPQRAATGRIGRDQGREDCAVCLRARAMITGGLAALRLPGMVSARRVTTQLKEQLPVEAALDGLWARAQRERVILRRARAPTCAGAMSAARRGATASLRPGVARTWWAWPCSRTRSDRMTPGSRTWYRLGGRPGARPGLSRCFARRAWGGAALGEIRELRRAVADCVAWRPAWSAA